MNNRWKVNRFIHLAHSNTWQINVLSKVKIAVRNHYTCDICTNKICIARENWHFVHKHRKRRISLQLCRVALASPKLITNTKLITIIIIILIDLAGTRWVAAADEAKKWFIKTMIKFIYSLFAPLTHLLVKLVCCAHSLQNFKASDERYDSA